MPNPFHPAMARKSDEELNAVILNQRDYVPEAIGAAFEELRRRGTTDLELEAMEAEGLARKEMADARAELPLDLREKQLYFIFSFLLFSPLAAFFYRKYADRGEERRSWDSMAMVVLGLLFYGAVYSVLHRLELIPW